jgi:hypothetical protein
LDRESIQVDTHSMRVNLGSIIKSTQGQCLHQPRVNPGRSRAKFCQCWTNSCHKSILGRQCQFKTYKGQFMLTRNHFKFNQGQFKSKNGQFMLTQNHFKMTRDQFKLSCSKPESTEVKQGSIQVKLVPIQVNPGSLQVNQGSMWVPRSIRAVN